jgi:ABC-type transport system involved in multi-copper enzyme maturation permease subunit
MRLYELVKETVLREPLVLVAHLALFGLYIMLGLLPTRGATQWGKPLFLLAGIFLPMLVTRGIFGDDIATGRITVLATEPMRFATLYLGRLAGVVAQCVVHLAVGSGIFLVISLALGKGSFVNFPLWLLGALCLFTAFAALSCTLSLIVKGSYNFMALLFGTAAFGLMVSLMGPAATGLSGVLVRVVKYAFPPVQLLGAMCRGATPVEAALRCGHAALLAAVYATIGVIILNKREFRRTAA